MSSPGINALSRPRPVGERDAEAGPAAAPRWPRPSKRFACLLSFVLVLVTLSPIVENWRPEPEDDFPLSYYPMFSEPRDDAQRLSYLVGRDEQGIRHVIPHGVAAPGGMNQVRKQINTRVRRGQAARLCRSVSSELARRWTGRYADIVTVEVVSGTYRLSEYFTGHKAPIEERIQASCPVERGRR